MKLEERVHVVFGVICPAIEIVVAVCVAIVFLIDSDKLIVLIVLIFSKI